MGGVLYITWEDNRTGTPFVVDWADTRYGAAELYVRCGGWYSFGWEERLTQLPGECRHPSVRSEYNCGDGIMPYAIVVFEHTAPGGVAETWAVCGGPPPWSMGNPRRVSPNAGLARAMVAAFKNGWNASHVDRMALWTEEIAGGPTLLSRRGRFTNPPLGAGIALAGVARRSTSSGRRTL
jgi:hypothetical protein